MEFNTFYGFTATPFTRNVPADKLYSTEEFQESLGRLRYASEHQLFALVTGDCGTGKTTLIRKLASILDDKKYRLLYLSDSKLTPRNFYHGLLDQLGCESHFYRGDAMRQLHRQTSLLLGMQGLHLVVTVDESHLLSKAMLEEIRFLLNVKMDSESPLALILVGQSELWECLSLQAYTAVRQRIDIRCRVPHLRRDQTARYIASSLENVKCTAGIFSDSAISAIYQYSAGTVRLINKVCTQCLFYGAQKHQRILDDHIVSRVVKGDLS